MSLPWRIWVFMMTALSAFVTAFGMQPALAGVGVRMGQSSQRSTHRDVTGNLLPQPMVVIGHRPVTLKARG